MSRYQDQEEWQSVRDREQQAESLMGAIQSSNGRVLGIKLPEPFPSLWDVFSGRALQFISDSGGKAAGDFVASATRSGAAGRAVELGLTYGLPHVPQAVGLAMLAKEHKANRAVVLDPLESLLKANISADQKMLFNNGYSGNKMVEYALGRVTEGTYQGLKFLAVDSVTAVKNNATSFLDKKNDELSNKEQKALGLLQSDWSNDLVGTARLGIKKTLKSINVEEALDNTSLGKVYGLEEIIRRGGLDSPNTVASSEDVNAVAEKVSEIFQAYQKEQKHRHIPTHRLQEVSKAIAKELIEGDLHALSLVNLVGNERLLNDKKDGLVSGEKLAEVITKEIKTFSKNSAITSEDFLKNHDTFTLDDIKAHIQSKDVDERALTAVLVPESVLMETGVKKETIEAWKKHLSAKMQEAVFGAVVTGLAQQSDEQLAEKKFSREAVMFIREHDQSQQGAESIEHAMKTRATAEAVKDVVLTELMGEPSQKWQSYIANVKNEAASALGKNDGKKRSHSERSGKGSPRSPMDHADRDSGEIHR